MNKRYLTRYERLEANLDWGEGPKIPYKEQLGVLYKDLFSRELDGGSILSLGIGTGLVEELAETASDRVIGLDISSEYLAVAKQRLPKAEFIKGPITEKLPLLPKTPQALASDFFNCISPRDYLTVFKGLRVKTDKIVIVNVQAPLSDFFEIIESGGPGIGGWNSAQKDSVSAFIEEELGVVSPKENKDRLVEAVLRFSEKELGGRLNTSIRELMGIAGLDFGGVDDEELGGLSYIEQVQFLLEYMRISASLREKFNPFSGVYLVEAFFKLLVTTMTNECLLKLIVDAAREAGFEWIRRGRINVDGNSLVGSLDIVRRINLILEEFKKGDLGIIKSFEEPSVRLLINGAPMKFWGLESIKRFKAVSCHYLILA